MMALSSAEIPPGIPAMKIYKKRKCAGDDGKKEKVRTPFFPPLPVSFPGLWHKEAYVDREDDGGDIIIIGSEISDLYQYLKV